MKEGLFPPEATDFFDWCEHHDSVPRWQERLASEEWGPVAPLEMIETSQRLLSSGGGELVIKIAGAGHPVTSVGRLTPLPSSER